MAEGIFKNQDVQVSLAAHRLGPVSALLPFEEHHGGESESYNKNLDRSFSENRGGQLRPR